MAQQSVLLAADRDSHQAHAETDAMFIPALRLAFPVPHESEERFSQLLEAIARRTALGDKQPP